MNPTDCSSQRPQPLPHHLAMVAYLKAEEADLWKWFAATERRAEKADSVRLDLLKSTYRLDATSQSKLYSRAEEVGRLLGLTVPVTFYQTQTGGGMNAALAHLPGEAHIVLTGPVLTSLSDLELRALLAHELAHYLLFEGWEGDFLVATELLHSLGHDPAATGPHLESARLFRLYAEIFADRASYFVTGDVAAGIGTLIKLETGLSEVDPESYLRQAEEIFSKTRVQADQLTHPEPYIRARALKLWAEQGDDAVPEIQRMIEGPLTLGRLDLLGQRRVAGITRRLLDCLLAPTWFHSEPILAHARLFFDGFSAPTSPVDEATLAEEMSNSDAALQDYFCYVLLDFVTVDRELGDAALASALDLSRRLGLKSRFADVAIKELGLGKKYLERLLNGAPLKQGGN